MNFENLFLLKIINGFYIRWKHLYQTVQYRIKTFSPFSRVLKSVPAGTLLEEFITKCDENLNRSFLIDYQQRESIVKRFISSHFRDVYPLIISGADDILNHKFNLPDSNEQSSGKKIQWNIDLLSGHKWPVYRSTEIPIFISKNTDILRIWEVSRFHWAITLGKAYWLSGNEKYAHEIRNQCLDWIKFNPLGFGPNWKSTQDVALRAVSWIDSLCFFNDPEIFRMQDRQILFASLYQHGIFIEQHLDLNYLGKVKTTGTHYLSNLLGLLYLGLLFQFLEKGKKWIEYSTKEFFNEMEYQVDSDGADYESSIACYHRFALEHFLTAYLLFLINNIAVPSSYPERLEKMFDFVFAYSRLDGSVPQIGDNSEIRVPICSAFNAWPPDDHHDTLAVGAELFSRPEFNVVLPKKKESSFWLLSRLRENGRLSTRDETKPLLQAGISQSFPESGFYFMKSTLASTAISANPVGMKGKGNHKHNDIFSIDLFFNDAAFIVDPGSYVYTSDLEERYRFRSTAYHNVLQINQCEQNNIFVDRPWRVEEQAHPRVIKWETTPVYDLFIGQHQGFADSVKGLIIQRKIYFNKLQHIWLIQDNLLNDEYLSNSDTISVYFHLNSLPYFLDDTQISYSQSISSVQDHFNLTPGKTLFQNGVRILSGKSELTLRSAAGNELQREIRNGWISRTYGIREEAPILVYTERYQGQKSFTFHIEAVVKQD